MCIPFFFSFFLSVVLELLTMGCHSTSYICTPRERRGNERDVNNIAPLLISRNSWDSMKLILQISRAK